MTDFESAASGRTDPPGSDLTATSMRAAVVTRHGSAFSPVEVRRVPLVGPRPGWVNVRLRAAGLNRLDAMMLGDARRR